MRLTKVEMRNYRLLVKADLTIDKDTTLIVGRNNTAKTSFLLFLASILNNESLKYSDYPLSKRKDMINCLIQFLAKNISYEQFCENLPKPSMKFYIDYNEEHEEDFLSGLSPFIIDVEDDVSQAIIFAEYLVKISESDICEMFKEVKIPKDESENRNNVNEDVISNIKDILSTNFSNIFSLSIKAINPKDDTLAMSKSVQELKALFPLFSIRAERNLDESDNNRKSSLQSIISDYFSLDENNLNNDIKENVLQLRQIVNEANNRIQKDTDSLLSKLVDKSVGFGYPNAEELQLGVITKLSLPERIQNNSELTYRNSDNDSLPSEYNGLGYKNLIKIQFQLAQYANQLKQCGIACLPLLFIEEPESHMHPQMQQVFISYLEDFLKEVSDVHIQVIITSHSSHITNVVDFSKIRYSQRGSNGVIYKNLNDFANENAKNIDFIRKYMTISRCDLFFADKAIFIEGASERLLLPDIIKKNDDLKLSSQYITLVEVGGAYAYKFIPLVKFLGIPSLIITDIDPVNKMGGRTFVSNGHTTSNATIKHFMRDKLGIEEKKEITMKDIKELSQEQKTLNKVHIEFQTTENGICGRSLEEAIRNVNREFYMLGDSVNEDIIKFKDKSKTEFALNLIINATDGYNVPKYIKNGLKWLNDQPVII